MVTRDKLRKKLYSRYNLQEPQYISVVLPHSKAKVKIVYHDFRSQVTSLLTDPRISPETDYLFHNDDPLSPPPAQEALGYIEDINTGLAYIKTHKELIASEEVDEATSISNKVLLPIIFYMDSAVTGQ